MTEHTEPATTIVDDIALLLAQSNDTEFDFFLGGSADSDPFYRDARALVEVFDVSPKGTQRLRQLTSVDELDTLPEQSLVQTAESLGGWDTFTYFQKQGDGPGNRWMALDPSDRDDGEYLHPSGFVWNTAHGFGQPRDGRVTLLFSPVA